MNYTSGCYFSWSAVDVYLENLFRQYLPGNIQFMLLFPPKIFQSKITHKNDLHVFACVPFFTMSAIVTLLHFSEPLPPGKLLRPFFACFRIRLRRNTAFFLMSDCVTRCRVVGIEKKKDTFFNDYCLSCFQSKRHCQLVLSNPSQGISVEKNKRFKYHFRAFKEIIFFLFSSYFKWMMFSK